MQYGKMGKRGFVRLWICVAKGREEGQGPRPRCGGGARERRSQARVIATRALSAGIQHTSIQHVL